MMPVILSVQDVKLDSYSELPDYFKIHVLKYSDKGIYLKVI